MKITMNKLKRFMSDRDYRFMLCALNGLYNDMPDDEYLKRMFRAEFGYTPDFDNPVTLNEKLQWLKLYNRKPIYTRLVDKYEAKGIVTGIIGEEYIIPTLGVWDRFDDIDFDKLPNQFVLKCTHDSGGLVICRNKSKLDIEKARKKINKSLKTNYYFRGREWPYKNVKPRIIAEEYMTDAPDTDELTDYKFYCFNGYVDCVLVCYDRASGDTKFYFFDKDWKLKRYNKRGKDAPEGFSLPKPPEMDKMFSIAATLSKGIPFLRVDLYNSRGHIYFGELTLYPASGYDVNRLRETDEYFGKLVDLNSVK